MQNLIKRKSVVPVYTPHSWVLNYLICKQLKPQAEILIFLNDSRFAAIRKVRNCEIVFNKVLYWKVESVESLTLFFSYNLIVRIPQKFI